MKTKNSDDYDEKYMKMKFNSDDDLPPNKTINIRSMIIVVRAVFHKDNNYYPQVFLQKMLTYDEFSKKCHDVFKKLFCFF